MSDEPKSDIPAGTPEGYTKEEPAASELGEPGTPGAGTTAAAPHAADVEDGEVAHHDAATHMDAHTVLSDDDHGHAEATLGPIDWSAWGYSVVGALAGIVVLYFFWVAVS
jgi:hypothetical protein